MHKSSVGLQAGSWSVLVLAVFACALLIERFSAALWQWYKFRDFGGGGHITLSQSSSMIISIALALLTLASFVLWQIAQPKSKRWPAVRSLLAASLAAACLAAYWALGASPLNEWRH